jgi:DNA-directed RNA polymerase alpha subunit
MLLPKDLKIVSKIEELAQKGFAIAELEYLGLSLRVINALEESKYKIVYLKDLLSLKDKELKSIENLGASGLKQISASLQKMEFLEDEKKKWHRQI